MEKNDDDKPNYPIDDLNGTANFASNQVLKSVAKSYQYENYQVPDFTIEPIGCW